jgi:Cu(I)-responsive transcriptional regulator
MSFLNIGAAAKTSGVSAKMIRHYEEVGLLPRAKRTDSGYRVYDENDVHTLRFVRRGRDLGFSMKEIKQLLGLWRNRSRSSSEVKKLAENHIRELEAKIQELKAMTRALRSLSSNCHGDQRPECPILSDLAKG